jgi:quinol monooxygenase YgiN
MLAFEVYGNREDLYDTHFNSVGMKPFLAATPGTMSTGFDLSHYAPTSGFLARKPTLLNGDTCAIIYDTNITCASQEAASVVVGRLNKLAKYVESEEKGTESWLVLQSLDESAQVRIFERYASWKALESHLASAKWKQLLLGSKEEIRGLQGRPYVPNRKGWLTRDVLPKSLL